METPMWRLSEDDWAKLYQLRRDLRKLKREGWKSEANKVQEEIYELSRKGARKYLKYEGDKGQEVKKYAEAMRKGSGEKNSVVKNIKKKRRIKKAKNKVSGVRIKIYGNK